MSSPGESGRTGIATVNTAANVVVRIARIAHGINARARTQLTRQHATQQPPRRVDAAVVCRMQCSRYCCCCS